MGGDSNYAACHNDVDQPIGEDNNGVMFLNSSVDYDQIPDGSSNTIFVGEKLVHASTPSLLRGTKASLRNTSGINLEVPSWGAALQQNANPASIVGAFASTHPGGAQFVFGDGSVHFLSENIYIETLQHLGNRRDGGLIQEF